MTVKVYEYQKCSTCQKAIKYLEAKKISYERVPIVETPPSIADLKTMLGFLKVEGKTFKSLFNTSGIQYRAQKISEKIKDGMTESEALQLLSKNGMLVKRPFLLARNGGTVGFKPERWTKILKG